MVGRFIGVDWGTTNLRAWLVDGGAVLEETRSDRGVRALSPEDYPGEIARLRARLGDLPVLAAGMVGSTRGWRDAAYVPAPAGLDDLARRLTVAADRVRIVPGVSYACGTRADVMRGEEVQLLGAVAAGLAPADALLVQPGTHSKWAWLERGRIMRFATAMTGELFALLKEGSVLAEMMQGRAEPGEAFLAGVDRAAGARDLLTALFEVRASVLLGRTKPRDAASMASGLLIGADIAAREVTTRDIHVLSEGILASLYAAAIERLGGRVHHVDSSRAFLAGIERIEELSR